MLGKGKTAILGAVVERFFEIKHRVLYGYCRLTLQLKVRIRDFKCRTICYQHHPFCNEYNVFVCLDVITMQQSINASSAPNPQYGPAALSTNGTILFTATALEDLLYQIYSRLTYSIVRNGIKVKTMQLASDSQFVSVIYEVYTNVETISPTTITEFYKEGERRKITQWLIALPPLAGNFRSCLNMVWLTYFNMNCFDM